MIIAIYVWRYPKGRYYGNQVNLGDFRRYCQERYLLFPLAFDNGSDDHEAAFKRLNSNYPATSRTNLVNFPSNNLRVHVVKPHNFCRDSAAIRQ